MIDVLLVEDMHSDAELTMRALRRAKLVKNLVWIKDGVEALDYLLYRAQYKDRERALPKLVLLDIHMPKLSGLEVLEALRAHPATHAIPIVVMTSSAETPDVKTAYKLGANSYIVKPVESQNFNDVVTRLGIYWMQTNHAPD